MAIWFRNRRKMMNNILLNVNLLSSETGKDLTFINMLIGFELKTGLCCRNWKVNQSSRKYCLLCLVILSAIASQVKNSCNDLYIVITVWNNSVNISFICFKFEDCVMLGALATRNTRFAKLDFAKIIPWQ